MRIKSTQRSIRTRVNEDTLSNRVEKLHYPRCLVIVKKKKKGSRQQALPGGPADPLVLQQTRPVKTNTVVSYAACFLSPWDWALPPLRQQV